MNDKVIYTCITGNYDILREPLIKSKGFDYICFTDQNFKSDLWEIRPLPAEVEGLSNAKKQRWIKINAHKVLPEYQFSIWVDGNIEMNADLNRFFNEKINKKPFSFFVGIHPQRDCVYEEAKACIELKKDTKDNIDPQMDAYRKEGLPSHNGLPQTCMLFRYHNNSECIKLMESWWCEMEKWGHRDQLSFPYAQWKNNDIKIGWLDKSIFKSIFFRRGSHIKKLK